MPSLVKLFDEFKDNNFVVLAIDIQEKREVVKKYSERFTSRVGNEKLSLR